MIKIHAGKYKGQKINITGIDSTRETASMVREAVFNSLYEVDGKVLDLFAGSGSLGITALSMGASFCYFIDNNFKATKNIKDNLDKLKISNYKVINQDYNFFLKNNLEIFDLIFLDPPYDFKEYKRLLIEVRKVLNLGGKIILEVSSKLDDILIDSLGIIKSKKYGNKKIIIYQGL